MHSFLTTTNAVKAQIIVLINAIFALLSAFGFDLSDKQQAAILVVINAIFALWVALTYKFSHKRVDREI
jgi:hypothetical protein